MVSSWCLYNKRTQQEQKTQDSYVTCDTEFMLSPFSHGRLCNPMDCSPTSSSVHGILQARILEWVVHALLQGIFLTQGSNPPLLHWQWILHHQATREA